MHERTSIQPRSTRLRKELSLWQVTSTGIGVILGAGVYALIAPAAGMAGNLLWAAFAIASVAAGLTAYAYARLGAMRPKASAEFQYTSLALGKRVGLVAGILMLAADLLAAAAVALGFGGYLAHILDTSPTLNAVMLTVGLGALMLAGIKQSVSVAIVLTMVEVGGLVVVSVIGLPFVGQTNFLAPPSHPTGILHAASLIFFAYVGFDELGNLAEEMRNPKHDLPRAVMLSVLGATLMYILVALSAVAVVGWQDLSASAAPLALVAGRVLGPRADILITAMALAVTANTVLLLLVSGARSLYGMAAAGVLPHKLATIGIGAVPVPATLLVIGITVVLSLSGDLPHVASLSNAAVLLVFATVNLSLVVVTRRGSGSAPHSVLALDHIVPILGALLCMGLFAFTGWMSITVVSVIAVMGYLFVKYLLPQPYGEP